MWKKNRGTEAACLDFLFPLLFTPIYFLTPVIYEILNINITILFFSLNRPHYNVNLKGIDVGGESLQIPSDIFDASKSKGTIIDSGTTLAYLPDAAYKPLVNAVWLLRLFFL